MANTSMEPLTSCWEQARNFIKLRGNYAPISPNNQFNLGFRGKFPKNFFPIFGTRFA
jgi:hypothetical protein